MHRSNYDASIVVLISTFINVLLSYYESKGWSRIFDQLRATNKPLGIEAYPHEQGREDWFV